MSKERTRRVALNESLFRAVNEQAEKMNRAFAMLTGDLAIVCECGNLDCQEQLSVTVEDYERIRSVPTRFIVKPGHEIESEEDVVDSDGAYLVVEKTPPAARAVASETDPRTDTDTRE